MGLEYKVFCNDGSVETVDFEGEPYFVSQVGHSSPWRAEPAFFCS